MKKRKQVSKTEAGDVKDLENKMNAMMVRFLEKMRRNLKGQVNFAFKSECPEKTRQLLIKSVEGIQLTFPNILDGKKMVLEYEVANLKENH